MIGPPLTDEEYRLFSEWLAREIGLRFGPEKREILRARLEPLRAEVDVPTFERLLFHVRYHPAGADARLRMLSYLTNNESYFFREPTQLALLRTEVLPALAADPAVRRRGVVRLLSAGSASGEEAYTLAIIAREVLGRSGPKPVVTGIDLDPAAVERARTAVYRAHAFRGVPEEVRGRYFRAVGPSWQLDPSVRDAARFEQANLLDQAWTATLPPQDVVFCRNVLIYFDEAAVRRAVDNLFDVVRPGGCVFLGHAETLSRMPTRFVAQRRPGAMFYRRPEG